MTKALKAALAAMAAVAGVLIAAVPAAQAVIVRLPDGQAKSYQPLRGTPRPFDSCFLNLDYSGGPVMASNTELHRLTGPRRGRRAEGGGRAWDHRRG